MPLFKVGSDIDFTIESPAIEGELPGLFSVSATQQVRFSQGNLQYQPSTQTWRFAQHQYDRVSGTYSAQSGDGCNSYTTTYTGWIELFGWGTGNNPLLVSTDVNDYTTFVDWGVNAISNGGNEANVWRTLTWDESRYLFSSRLDAANKYAKGTVNGVVGLIILPDNWTLPTGRTFTPGINSSNSYSLEQWNDMELAGAVFLPCAGIVYPDFNYGWSYDGGESACYWTSTVYPYDDSYAMALNMYFSSSYVRYYLYINHAFPVNYLYSVRLVHDN